MDLRSAIHIRVSVLRSSGDPTRTLAFPRWKTPCLGRLAVPVHTSVSRGGIVDEHQGGYDHKHAPGCCGGSDKASEPGTTTTVTDPVCGMKVNPATSRHRFDHAGTTHHFCSADCQTKFAADPEHICGQRSRSSTSCAGCDLRLPDAPADSPTPSRAPNFHHSHGHYRRASGTTGFVVQPRRWLVERLLSWFVRWRRLSKDYEVLPEVSEAMVTLAAICLCSTVSSIPIPGDCPPHDFANRV